jgi:hypothetical protein
MRGRDAKLSIGHCLPAILEGHKRLSAFPIAVLQCLFRYAIRIGSSEFKQPSYGVMVSQVVELFERSLPRITLVTMKLTMMYINSARTVLSSASVETRWGRSTILLSL